MDSTVIPSPNHNFHTHLVSFFSTFQNVQRTHGDTTAWADVTAKDDPNATAKMAPVIAAVDSWDPRVLKPAMDSITESIVPVCAPVYRYVWNTFVFNWNTW